MKKTFIAGGFHKVPPFEVEVEPTDLVTGWGPAYKLWSMHVKELSRISKIMCGMSDCMCGCGLRPHSTLDDEHVLISGLAFTD